MIYRMSNSKSAYLRFLALTEAIAGGLGDDIDPTCLALLEVVGLAAEQGSPLTVTKAMNLSQLASPATIHRKLTQLIEAGYVDQQFEGKNRRTKYLMPTTKAKRYFAVMGEAIKASSSC